MPAGPGDPRFTLALDDVASAASAFPDTPVELVWSAGTLADREWANELHPKAAGFARLVRECWIAPGRQIGRAHV